jgi:two-component system sensor histidine kinase EvgS
MGGTLQLSSQLGQGTQVRVKLPLTTLAKAIPVPTPLSEGTPLNLRSLRVLVVDDYRPNRLLLEKQLRYLGHQVNEASDGSIGLCLWLKEHFDVVITDCNMPNMDGYALAREIRRYEQENGKSPCLLLGFTANAQPEERQRCRDAGMDGCLFKPSTLHDLGGWLEQYVIEVDAEPQVKGSSASLLLLQGLQPLTGGDHGVTKQLLTELARSNREDSQLLAQLWTLHDIAGLSELAHKLKGGARIISADTLVKACEVLEELCDKPDVMPDVVSVAVQDLRNAMEEFELTVQEALEG